MKKFDAIVILGVMLKDDGKISDTLTSRLDEGIKFYNNNVSKIIMVGGLSNIKVNMTEAEAMKKYALMKDVKNDDILKEEKSVDTIGNIFFLKRDILIKENWKNLIVVTSDFHMKRVKYLFKKILGKDYKIKFVESKSDISGEDEKDFMSLSKALFKNVKDGDDKEIGEILNKTHPLYSDKSLMKLSDEKLSEKFNLDIKTIKKLRKFIEEKIKHEGKD